MADLVTVDLTVELHEVRFQILCRGVDWALIAIVLRELFLSFSKFMTCLL